ncbi:class I SAM-dependent methyltransferase [bacterium SPL81]|nr:class I SAM-dependent methyltransferase [Acinetobacter baumannii]
MEDIHELSRDYRNSLVLDGRNLTHLEDLKQLWDKEYGLYSTIPSSQRVVPAHALVQLLQNYTLSGEMALDLGCGNGRNSFFLAANGFNVTAIDFSQTALTLLEAKLEKQKASAAVSHINHDIRNGLPFESESMDLVLDSYCLCHFINDEERRDVMHEIYRVLKPGGKLIKIHLDVNDEYYLERLNSKTDYGHISYDPINSLPKMHMSLEAYLKDIGSHFRLASYEEVKFTDDVRGSRYERSIFVCVSEKK